MNEKVLDTPVEISKAERLPGRNKILVGAIWLFVLAAIFFGILTLSSKELHLMIESGEAQEIVDSANKSYSSTTVEEVMQGIRTAIAFSSVGIVITLILSAICGIWRNKQNRVKEVYGMAIALIIANAGVFLVDVTSLGVLAIYWIATIGGVGLVLVGALENKKMNLKENAESDNVEKEQAGHKVIDDSEEDGEIKDNN